MKRTALLCSCIAFFFLPEMRSQVCSGLNFQVLSEIPSDCGHMPLSLLHDQLDRPFLYVAQKEGGLRVLDISDPEEPNPTQGIEVSALGELHVMNLFQSGNYLYLALGNHFGTAAQSSGMAIVDVSIPASPMLLDVWISPGPEGGAGIVLVEGDYAYLGAMGNGLFILDVSNPNEIEFISDFVPDIFYPDPNPDSAKFNARGMALRDQIVYLCYDAGGLRIINVSDKENPKETGRYANPALNGLPRAYNNIQVAGELAYIAVDYCGMEVLDISDTSDITLHGWWNPWNCQTNPLNWFSSPGHANEISYDPGCELIYLSTGKSDLHVLDVSDPSQPDSCNFFGGVSNLQGSWGLGRYKQELYLTYICAVIPFFSNWTGVKILSYDAPCTSATVEEEPLPFSLAPNPAAGLLTLRGLPENTASKAEVFDLLGRRVPTNGHAEWNAGEFSLNISGLSPGLYLLRVESGGKVYVAEFVKIRD